MAALGNMEAVNLTTSPLASDSPGSPGDDLGSTRSSSITEVTSQENSVTATTASALTDASATLSPSTLTKASNTQDSAQWTTSSTNATTLPDISTAEQTDAGINDSSPASETQTSVTVTEVTTPDTETQTSVTVTEVTASDSDLTTMDDVETMPVTSPWQSTTEKSNRITDHTPTVHIETASTVTDPAVDFTTTSAQIPTTFTSSTETDIQVLKTTVTSQGDVTAHTVLSSGVTTVRDSVTTTGSGSISVDSQATTQAPAAESTQPGVLPPSSHLWLGVGLGIGAVLIVIIIIIIVFCCRKRCKRRSSQYDEDFVKEYEIVYNPSRKPYKRSFEKRNPTENLAPKRSNYFEEGLKTGVENPNYHFVPDKGNDNILRNNKSTSRPIEGLEAESRFSIGPVMLDDEGIPSTGETYDKMYRTHNTFRRGEQAPK